MVDPGDTHLLGYFWNKQFYIDLALAMGIRSAAFLCQRITDAIRFIVKSFNVNIVNYIDDLAGVAAPEDASYAYNTMGSILSELGVEEAPDKSSPPSPIMEFLGVEFNVQKMTMSVTPERIIEIKQLIHLWLSKTKATKRQLQSLIGKLQFISKCVRPGRIFVSRLLHILPSLSRPHHRFYINSQIKKDLFWWSKFLDHFNGVTLIPNMLWSVPDTVFSTDACLQSSGGWCGKEYFSVKFPRFILDKCYNINILELLTVMIAIKTWGPKCRDQRIQIYCDHNR
jgi:hypothetical protein